MPHRQRGVALITAILVVSVAVLASTSLLTSGHLALRRMESLRDTEQAWWLVRGVEAWVMEILKQDTNEYDGLDPDELWSQPIDYLPLDDRGFLRGRLVDQQGMFNLNNLYPDRDGLYAGHFRRLMELLRAQNDFEGPVPDLVPAIRDWMDPDQFPKNSGVEDSEYLSLEPPYRAANREFSSISELRAVYGVSEEIYEALVTGCPLSEEGPPQPCISALPGSSAPAGRGSRGRPSGRGTAVNVNTASRNVLLSLAESTNEAKLDAFLDKRTEKPAPTKKAFKELEIYPPPKKGKDNESLYDVRTEYFQIRGEVVVGSSRLPLYSLIRRTGRSTTVVAHGVAEE